jgi:hypothetical protein
LTYLAYNNTFTIITTTPDRFLWANCYIINSAWREGCLYAHPYQGVNNACSNKPVINELYNINMYMNICCSWIAICEFFDTCTYIRTFHFAPLIHIYFYKCIHLLITSIIAICKFLINEKICTVNKLNGKL